MRTLSCRTNSAFAAYRHSSSLKAASNRNASSVQYRVKRSQRLSANTPEPPKQQRKAYRSRKKRKAVFMAAFFFVSQQTKSRAESSTMKLMYEIELNYGVPT